MTESTTNKKFDLAKILTGVAIFLCTISLAFIAISLSTIAHWAENQNTCVEQESSKAPIAWAVRKCNGRSKVYQVK